VPVALILLCAVPLPARAVRLVTLAGGAAITPENARFFSAPLPVVLHIAGDAAAYTVPGAVQFAAGSGGRRPGWHRVAGRLLVACGLLVGLSGLWMTLSHPRQPGTGGLLYALRLLFGSAMVACIGLGSATIRRGDARRHRAWMVRAYAIGLGAGAQVRTRTAGALLAGPPGGLGHDLLMGASWVINLAVAEWATRRRPARRGRTAAAVLAPSAA
jgi:uncharacterized membrane protein